MKIHWKSCFKIGVSVFIVFLCINYWASLVNFFKLVFLAGLPLIIGGFIAYLVNILMSFYEKHFFPKQNNIIVRKLRRPICILGAFLTMIAIISVIISLVLPQLISCMQLIFRELPSTLERLTSLAKKFGIVPEDFGKVVTSIDWQARMGQIIDLLTTGVGDLMGTVFKAVTTVFSAAVTILLSLIFSIYLLIEKDKIGAQLTRVIYFYLPTEFCNKFKYFLTVLNDCFHRYIVGQCTEAVILGLLCTFGMSILNIPYPAMIGTLIGFTALVPIVGAYIGAGVGAFMIFTVSPLESLIFLVFIVILQQLEGNIIYPRVVGSSMGLPGIWVLAAVTIGGGIMGIPGMLIGVPLTATIYRIIRDDMNKEQVKNKKKFKISVNKRW